MTDPQSSAAMRILSLLSLLAFSGAQAYTPKGFIKVCNGRFADGHGKLWTFAGWNGYTDLMNDAYDHLYNGKPDLVTKRFRQAKEAGLTAVRIWGHGDADRKPKRVLQPQQGEYNQKVFRSLDYIMFTAAKYNVRVLISLTTFWQDDDGILAYAKWAGLTYPKLKKTPFYTEQWEAKDKFWTSNKARSYYRKHMKVMFNRKNSFNNKAYKDDSTIFAWNLFNEPRCPAKQSGPSCTGRITKWGNMMFKYAKKHNKKQLFSFGQEGFFAKDGWLGRQPGGKKWYEDCNPSGVPGNVQSGWAGRVGQDFSSQGKNGDFMEYHLWPNNWFTPTTKFARKWIQCHMELCNKLKLPCVLGEFGRELPGKEGDAKAIATIRNPYFKAVYKENRRQIYKYKNFGGDMFWQWVDNEAPLRIPNAVRTKDSTFQKIIKKHAWLVTKYGTGRQLCPATS